MKTVLKVVAYVIDVALMPIRALLSLEIIITGAIMSDISVKDGLEAYWETIKQYPSQLIEATKIIFKKEES